VDRLAELLASTPPDRVGRALAAARDDAGRSQLAVARAAGLPWRTLRAIEAGRQSIDPMAFRAIAAVLDVDVRAVLAPHRVLRVDTEAATITVGERSQDLPAEAGEREILRAYLQLVRELRNRAPEEPLPLREDDLEQLAGALGGTPSAIEASLVELIDIEAAEAAQLRSAFER